MTNEPDNKKIKKHNIYIYIQNSFQSISENISKLLAKIETEGARYGLEFNYGKCEILQISRGEPWTADDSVKFKNGTPVKVKAEAKYLGCWLNDRGDPDREVKQRIANCMIVLKKLDILY